MYIFPDLRYDGLDAQKQAQVREKLLKKLAPEVYIAAKAVYDRTINNQSSQGEING